MIFSVLLHYHWEAMLISNLAARILVLPFDGINTLMSHSNYKIAVQSGTYQQSVLEDSLDPIWQAAWKERTEPYMDIFYKSYYGKIVANIIGLFNNTFKDIPLLKHEFISVLLDVTFSSSSLLFFLTLHEIFLPFMKFT